MFRHKHRKSPNAKLLLPHFDAQIVGCTITNDRRAAAGYTDSAACRFCDGAKESLVHIVNECAHAPSYIKELPKHDLGPNFPGLGIVEHPAAVVNHRLRLSSKPSLSGADFDGVCLQLHGGQTVQLSSIQESFWLTTAAFAIFNQEEQCVAAGPVCHPALSAYAAELFAFMTALTIAPRRLQVVTDCKTIVNIMFAELMSTRIVPMHWSHRQWWLCIWRQYNLTPVFVKIRSRFFGCRRI